METRVIVVGAGPVGLLLAGEIRLGGADVTVYDKLPEPSGESRALGFTRRVAEIFDQRGLLTRLGEFRQGRRGHFGGVGYDLSMLDESHHGVLGLPQSRTESMLTDWLTELGVPIRRGYEAVAFTETADGLELVLDGPEGRHQDSAVYLVGCDGPDSTIRTLAGIEAPGWESERGMYMADVTGIELRQRPTGEHVPGGNMILATNLGDGYYRVLIHDRNLPPHPDSAALTFTDVADAWQRMTGESIHHGSARWMAAFGNGAGLATTYRKGRVMLAGDAAHPTPPLAGWGLSTGIQDAANLGWKLAAVTTGRAPDSLLDTYHTERHPLGEQLLRNTHAATTLYLSGEEMDPLRGVLRELMDDKSAAEYFAGMVSGLGVHYGTCPGDHWLLGRRLSPDRTLDLPGGERTRVAELLRRGRGLLIIADGSEEPRHLTAAWADRVETVHGTWTPDTSRIPSQPLDAVLVRPDGHIAWAAPGSGDLTEALELWFGPARVTAGI